MEVFLSTENPVHKNFLFQDTRRLLSLGEPVGPWHVSHVSEVVVPTGLVRVPSAICVVVGACLPQQRHGEGGTGRLTPTRDGTLSAQPSQPQEYQPWSCLKVNEEGIAYKDL